MRYDLNALRVYVMSPIMLEVGVALALLVALLAALFGSERLYAGGVRRAPGQVTGPPEGGPGDGKVRDPSTV